MKAKKTGGLGFGGKAFKVPFNAFYMKSNFLFLTLVAFTLGSCSKDNDQLQQAEQILPGTWKIKSFQVPKDGLGVSFQGNTFYVDTTLYDIGSITIPDFSADDLAASFDQSHKVPCEVTIGNETFPFSINALLPSKNDLFSYFRYNGPDGLHPIITPEEAFIWSSFIFNNNYIIKFLDSKNIRLVKANNQTHVISLSRL
jgi:hypothetical protein